MKQRIHIKTAMIVGMCSGQALISTAEGGVSVRVEDMIVVPEYC